MRDALTPWTRNLAQQIDGEYGLVRAALRETRHRALNAGTLLLEAMAQVPPMTGPEWITQHTRLSLAEARGLMCLAKVIPLQTEVEARVESLGTDRPVEFGRARRADGADPERTLDARAHPDDAVVEAQVELCRAVLSRADATPSELAAVERVLHHIQNHGVSFLVDTAVDYDHEGAAGDDGLPC